MIEGNDIILKGVIPTKEAILYTMTKIWPNLVVEECGDDFFIYTNQSSKDSWDSEGKTSSNDDDMIYFLFSKNELTMVTDITKDHSHIVDKIKDQIAQID